MEFVLMTEGVYQRQIEGEKRHGDLFTTTLFGSELPDQPPNVTPHMK
jgi:hypothetical protein